MAICNRVVTAEAKNLSFFTQIRKSLGTNLCQPGTRLFEQIRSSHEDPKFFYRTFKIPENEVALVFG